MLHDSVLHSPVLLKLNICLVKYLRHNVGSQSRFHEVNIPEHFHEASSGASSSSWPLTVRYTNVMS